MKHKTKKNKRRPGGGVRRSPKRTRASPKKDSFCREEAFLRREWDGDLTSITREIQVKSRRVLVSIYCGKVLVAVFLGGRRKDTEHDYELSYALVDKRIRGCGLGSVLVQLCLALFFERAKRVFLGAERLEVYNKKTRKWDYVDDAVSPVVKFWKRQGFTKISLAEFGDEEAEVAPFRMTKQGWLCDPNCSSLFELIERTKKLLLNPKIQSNLNGVNTDQIKVRLNAPWIGDHFVDSKPA